MHLIWNVLQLLGEEAPLWRAHASRTGCKRVNVDDAGKKGGRIPGFLHHMEAWRNAVDPVSALVLITPSCQLRAGSWLDLSQASAPDKEMLQLLWAADVQLKLVRSDEHLPPPTARPKELWGSCSPFSSHSLGPRPSSYAGGGLKAASGRVDYMLLIRINYLLDAGSRKCLALLFQLETVAASSQWPRPINTEQLLDAISTLVNIQLHLGFYLEFGEKVDDFTARTDSTRCCVHSLNISRKAE